MNDAAYTWHPPEDFDKLSPFVASGTLTLSSLQKAYSNIMAVDTAHAMEENLYHYFTKLMAKKTRSRKAKRLTPLAKANARIKSLEESVEYYKREAKEYEDREFKTRSKFELVADALGTNTSHALTEAVRLTERMRMVEGTRRPDAEHIHDLREALRWAINPATARREDRPEDGRAYSTRGF